MSESIEEAQEKLILVLDEFIAVSPKTGFAYPAHTLRPPSSYTLLGTGYQRDYWHGRWERYTRFDAMRIESHAQILGHTVGNTALKYIAVWSNDISNYGYVPPVHDHIAFEPGEYTSASLDDYTRMTGYAQDALEQALLENDKQS